MSELPKSSVVAIALSTCVIIMNLIFKLSVGVSLSSVLFSILGVILTVFSEQFSEMSKRGGNFPSMGFRSLNQNFLPANESSGGYILLGFVLISISIVATIIGLF